jgi:putative intracellular protease/amidase
VKRLIGVNVAPPDVAKRKSILLVASKFGVWASELTLVAGTLMRAGYAVKIATEDGSPPHMLSPSLDPAFTDGAWRRSVVSTEEQALALRFLDPGSREHSLIEAANILNIGNLAKPPQVGEYLRNPSVLNAYKEALRQSLKLAEQFDAIVVAGGSGAVPGLMADRGLQSLILAFFDLNKPVMGECNGGLAIAQTVDPRTNRSILHGRAVTTHCWLDEYQQGWGWTGPFDQDTDQYWHSTGYDLANYSKAESWILPGVSGNPLIASESLFVNAAGSHGLFFSPAGSPYSVVVDGNLITCRTTPDGYPGALALVAIMDGDPPLRGRLFIDRDEQGTTEPIGNIL